MIDLPPPGYEQTIEAIVKCDIPRANVRIQYEDYLRSDEVTVSDLGGVTDEKMRCLRAAVHPFYILTISDQAQQAAFHDFTRREDRPREKAVAIEWVRSKGLSSKLPAYDPQQALSAFANSIETACGLTRGSALMVGGETWLTVRPDFLVEKRFKKSAAALECLMKMYAASDATEHGIRFGFIGNAAYIKDEKE